MIPKQSWDDYFMEMCDKVSARSHDENTKVGCVIVNEHHHIVSTGYNGLPPHIQGGWPTDRTQILDVLQYDDEHIEYKYRRDPSEIPIGVSLPLPHKPYKVIGSITKYDMMIHAELNAILHANGPVRGCTLYCQYLPCAECAKVLISAGIKNVVTRNTPMPSGKWLVSHILSCSLLQEAGIDVKYIGENSEHTLSETGCDRPGR